MSKSERETAHVCEHVWKCVCNIFGPFVEREGCTKKFFGWKFLTVRRGGISFNAKKKKKSARRRHKL